MASRKGACRTRVAIHGSSMVKMLIAGYRSTSQVMAGSISIPPQALQFPEDRQHSKAHHLLKLHPQRDQLRLQPLDIRSQSFNQPPNLAPLVMAQILLPGMQ